MTINSAVVLVVVVIDYYKGSLRVVEKRAILPLPELKTSKVTPWFSEKWVAQHVLIVLGPL